MEVAAVFPCCSVKLDPVKLDPNKVPTAIWGHIMTFMDDDLRFKMRAVDKMFYKGYFGTATSLTSSNQVSTKRILKLTAMGRVFRNVTHLNVGKYDIKRYKDDKAVPATGPLKGLPRLKSIVMTRDGWPPRATNGRYCNYDHSTVFPAFGKCEKVEYISVNWADLDNVTPEAFPNLKTLVSTGVYKLKPHPNLEEIRIEHHAADDEDFRNWLTPSEMNIITKANFPKLRSITGRFCDHKWAIQHWRIALPNLQFQVHRLGKEGIKVNFV